MATPNKIYLTPETTGVVKFRPQTAETAAKTSELLQENHEQHHIYVNNEGFHNHIAHHLLTLYGLGASKSQIERAYKDNVNYQRPATTLKERVVEDMSNPDHFKKYLGKEKYYHDFLLFFQAEMEKKGWEKTLQEYMFSGSDQANDIFGRMYAGFLHPIIHLGFGIEFSQPAIICEALAQACIHDTWTSKYLYSVSDFVSTTQPTPSKTIPDLLTAIHADTTLSTAAHWSDGNKIRDGILVRASSEMTSYATQWYSSPSTLDKQVIEMINSAIYFTAAAQNPLKEVKFDFYYMHCVNASIFFPTFLGLEWLSKENKVKLLNFKVWLDLAMYASRRSPKLLKEEIVGYEGGKMGWEGVFGKLLEFADDGHAVKLGRAVRNGEVVSKGWEGEEWAVMKGNMWEKVGNMVVDSVEGKGETWARSVGFEEAWENYADRQRAQL